MLARDWCCASFTAGQKQPSNCGEISDHPVLCCAMRLHLTSISYNPMLQTPHLKLFKPTHSSPTDLKPLLSTMSLRSATRESPNRLGSTSWDVAQACEGFWSFVIWGLEELSEVYGLRTFCKVVAWPLLILLRGGTPKQMNPHEPDLPG